jgi:hypothetical protein
MNKSGYFYICLVTSQKVVAEMSFRAKREISNRDFSSPLAPRNDMVWDSPPLFEKLLCLSLVMLVAELALSSCGGSAVAVDRNARLNAAFRQIQVHEAKIEAYRDEVWSPGAECKKVCDDAEGICGEGQHICSLAKEIEDGDALIRCRQANDTCDQAQSRGRVRCHCR